MKRYKYYLLYLIVILSCLHSLHAQMKQKRELLTEDYGRWHQLFTMGISQQGNWMTYTHHYNSNADTLFVKNTASFKVHAFAKGFKPNFVVESKLIYQQPGNTLTIFDLTKESSVLLEQISEYEIAKNNRYLVLQSAPNDKEALLITDINGKLEQEIPNLVAWKMDPTQSKVACITQKEDRFVVVIIELDKKLRKTTLFENATILRQLEWNASGTTLAFLSPYTDTIEKNARGEVYAYDTQTQKLATLYLSEHPTLAPTHAIGANYTTALLISDDGQRVFFGMEEKTERAMPDPSSVQVWNTADKSIYPGKIDMNDWRKRPIISIWWPANGKAMPITDLNLPFVQLDSKMKYAITSNPLAYEPQFKYHGDRDYYLTYLETGEKKLLLEAASGEPSDLVSSPDGKYLLYYKNDAWWSYDFASEKHTLLTKGINFVETERDDANAINALNSRVAGFTMEDKEVLIYDTYDIWKVRTDGTSTERITKGRETQTRFSLVTQPNFQGRSYVYDGLLAAEVDLTKPLYLKSVNEGTQQNGIYRYIKEQQVKKVVAKDRQISDILLTADHNKVLYTEQDFDLPPQMLLLDVKSKKEKIVHQSNLQHLQYYYGKSELFSFDVLGKDIGGVLLYPANYNPEKKYPMIVHVYQKQTMDLHQYQNPTLLDSRGFSVANFTTQGYFVALPNMLYEIGNTGEVATKCINAAVQSIVEKGIIDKDRIGLIGHSYGGYETNFIVTQKNPFKTAVSGASYSDLAADFLHVAWDFKTADYRRYEHGQMRMGKTLLEDPMRYHRNSPILSAQGLSIPLLLWTGAEDRHVDVNHSYKFHMALRRLQKENILLVYPNERHVIQKNQNQIDLSTKIKEWFDYHLKDGLYKPWMTPNYIEN